jgi:hypothetical protein
VLPHRQHVDHGKLLTWQQRGMVENFTKNFTVARKLPARALVGKNNFIADRNLINAVVTFDPFGLQTKFFGNDGRKPGGPIIKTSFNTVGNPNAWSMILDVCHNLSSSQHPADDLLH